MSEAKKSETGTSLRDAPSESIEVVISLLGRMAFPAEKLQGIVMRNKKNPLDYIRAYNLCDGAHTLSQIAAEIKVTPGTLSPILTEWKELGIIFEATRKGGRFYKRLYRLDVPKVSKKLRGSEASAQTSDGIQTQIQTEVVDQNGEQ